MKVSVYIATSLDGFIARKNGDLDWLDAASERVPESEDCGYFHFIESVDVLVMGRKTFEQVLSFGQWPYDDKPVIVLSSKAIEIPEEVEKTVSHSSESAKALCSRLSADGIKHLYIDGGITIQRFLAAGMVDDITITLIPVILGGGRPLFGDLVKDVLLRHVETKTYDFDFVQLKYQVIKNE